MSSSDARGSLRRARSRRGTTTLRDVRPGRRRARSSTSSPSWPATAPRSSSGSAPAASRCRSPSAASACTASTSRRRWSRGCARSPAPRRSASRSATSPRRRSTGTFSLAYLVFNTIMNLTTQDEQVACFQNVAAHLEPGGCFVIEVGVPGLQRLPPGETFQPFTVTPTQARLRRVRRRDAGPDLAPLLGRRRRARSASRCRSATCGRRSST